MEVCNLCGKRRYIIYNQIIRNDFKRIKFCSKKCKNKYLNNILSIDKTHFVRNNLYLLSENIQRKHTLMHNSTNIDCEKLKFIKLFVKCLLIKKYVNT